MTRVQMVHLDDERLFGFHVLLQAMDEHCSSTIRSLTR